MDRWIAGGAELHMSAVAWAEVLCGPIDEAQRNLAERVVGPPVPLTGDDAALAAQLFNLGGRRRGSLVDALIAAAAIHGGATLATTNPKDFARWSSAGLATFPTTPE